MSTFSKNAKVFLSGKLSLSVRIYAYQICGQQTKNLFAESKQSKNPNDIYIHIISSFFEIKKKFWWLCGISTQCFQNTFRQIWFAKSYISFGFQRLIFDWKESKSVKMLPSPKATWMLTTDSSSCHSFQCSCHQRNSNNKVLISFIIHRRRWRIEAQKAWLQFTWQRNASELSVMQGWCWMFHYSL